jgi:hypothetical protein
LLARLQRRLTSTSSLCAPILLGLTLYRRGRRDKQNLSASIVYPHSLDRAVKLLTFLVGQCHDDRIFINAKELGRVVVGIAED